jgi:hypothetical protein
MNDTENEVFCLTEDEKAKVTLYDLTSYNVQEEQGNDWLIDWFLSCFNGAEKAA